ASKRRSLPPLLLLSSFVLSGAYPPLFIETVTSLLDRHTGTALCERFWILPREQLLALYSKRKGVSLGRQLQVVLLARFPGTVRLSHHLVPIEIFEKGHFAWP